MKNQTALIIGAGPAGLTAAYELLTKTNIKPVIIEAEDYIGGLSRTFDYKNNKIDLGGHRFFSKSDIVMKWWVNIMPVQTVPSMDDILLNRIVDLSKNTKCTDPEETDDVMLVRNRISRIFFLKKFFDYPLVLSFRTIKNLGIGRVAKIGMSFMYSLFIKRKENNLENFMINRFGKQLYLTFFKQYTQKIWGIETKYIPVDWGIQRIKGLSILRIFRQNLKNILCCKIKQRNIETSLIEKFYYPKYGPGHFWQMVAKKIEDMGGKIFLNEKVKKINSENNIIKSVEVDSNGVEKKYDFDYLFSSMPVKNLINSFDKKDRKIEEIADNLKYRSFMIAGILVKKLEISNNTKIKSYKNRVPDEWIYIQDNGVKLGRLQIFNNWSPYLVNDYENTIWTGLEYFCDENDDMWNMKDNDFLRFASKEIEQIGILKIENIIDNCLIRVPKAYPSYTGSYDKFEKIKNYTDKYENLFLIGRNGMHKYNNMDHSMLTAITAVDNIIKNIKTKDNIWAVNTEQGYNEVK